MVLAKVTRECPASAGSSRAKAVRSNVAIPGNSPPPSLRSSSSAARSPGETPYVRPTSSADNNTRRFPSLASAPSVTASRSHAVAKFRGSTTCNSSGSPCSVLKIGPAAATDATVTEAATGSGTMCGLSHSNPTANACAQITPSRRAARHPHKFSTRDFPSMRSPDRSSPLPSRTRPSSSGGAYVAATTRPAACIRRASCSACQPPHSLRNRSVMGIIF